MNKEQGRQQCIRELLNLKDSFDALSGKWKIPLLQYLYNREQEPNHFRKIAQGIPGISDKMLAKELKELEANFLIEKEMQTVPRVTTVYRISPYGTQVIPVIKTLIEWGKGHREQVRLMWQKQ